MNDLSNHLPQCLKDALDWICDSPKVVAWHRSHPEIPFIVVAFYLVLVFYGPVFMKNRKEWNLKVPLAVWNLSLSLFSCFGAYTLIPHLLGNWREHGLRYTTCTPSMDWYSLAPHGPFVSVFIYSKIPELVDTIFLVLRKRPVIFLHWYHHVTVLLYCWHAFHTLTGPGIFFATMNYTVHSIMYFYYFLTNVGFFHVVRPFAPLITSLQLAQMVGGIVVLGYVASIVETEGPEACAADRLNYQLGFLMYASYFVLFAVFFWEKYIATPSPEAVKKKQEEEKRRKEAEKKKHK